MSREEMLWNILS